jgi:hypothetical protein
MKFLIIGILLFLQSTTGLCQNLVQGIKAEGIFKVSDDVTLEMAKQKALNMAFNETLEAAGVSIHVRSSTISNTAESGEYFRDLFLVSNEISMQGNIVDYEIIEDQKYIDNNDLFYKIGIVADVLMYKTNADEFFNFTVVGLNREYSEGEKLSFEFTTSQDAYLYIFSLSNDSLSTLYPNPYEPAQLWIEYIPVTFPISDRIDYEVDKEGDQSELIFVAVKERYDALISAVSLKELLLIYNSIEPFNKRLYSASFWVN